MDAAESLAVPQSDRLICLRSSGWEAAMPKATVQKYPCDETDLHSAIKVLVQYFDEIAETARRVSDREHTERALRTQPKSPQQSRAR
jgi:hypothetical protein